MTRRYRRSRKASHLDTVYYEIDMMEYAYERLVKRDTRPLPESNMLIESYLMHYRNLIEFFSGAKHRDRSAGKPRDISVKDAEVWAGRTLASEEQGTIATPAAKLVDAYFEDISQFLQHCTERRFLESRDWDVEGMCDEIKPIVAAFSSAFPRQVAVPEYGSVPESNRGNSTATFMTTTTTLFEAKLLGAVPARLPKVGESDDSGRNDRADHHHGGEK
jgi:hypothetical protein